MPEEFVETSSMPCAPARDSLWLARKLWDDRWLGRTFPMGKALRDTLGTWHKRGRTAISLQTSKSRTPSDYEELAYWWDCEEELYSGRDVLVVYWEWEVQTAV
ncbi:hypothetical protein BAUCODRAFT_27782 [Baudoinia panamericana UAMH 10762]|uniref:Uncharacterized protein n=1 Tax=Baudoinia panamericana (strain UAMH 10762) TaxID=717646 RepID=M2N1K5_BAUPA|nr:uncharacterized protein BAUCODRAFT_27782 [Baudoinia panamericana UAMH 10762]EMC92510.1 hypothetical protein BAUCODRAFT_27782 [Baudoinia panamericana UAMH 10762]